MKKSLILIAFSLAVGGGLRAAAPAPVEVIYVAPENFTDVKDGNVGDDRTRDDYLARLKQHMEKKASARIPAGQHLALRITDVDMAGDFEPWHGINRAEVRIIKEIYPPHIKLDFTLADANGKILKQGHRELVDLNFLRSPNPYFEDDPLRYEKVLLDAWFQQEFGPGKN